MAIDKLSIYNAAIIAVGGATLDTTTDNREERIALDVFYDDHSAPLDCLESSKPRFACKTQASTGSATAGGVTLAFSHAMPSDYLSLVAVYSDTELTQIVSRYQLDGNTLLSDYETLYVRYVRNDVAVADYSALFVKYLSLSLAESIAPKFAQDKVESIGARAAAAFEMLVSIEGEKEPLGKPAATGSDLSGEWMTIYNGALQILGKGKLPSSNADHPFRIALDTTLESGVVAAVLNDTNWRFGRSLAKIGYDAAQSPTSFGYRYVFQLPSDVLRRVGVYVDEYARVPLDDYHEENGQLFAERETIYVSYIDGDWADQPASWPADFRRLIMAKMAYEAANEIDSAKRQDALDTYNRAKTTAIGNDMAQAPPEPISGGSWVSSRFQWDRWHDRGRSGG